MEDSKKLNEQKSEESIFGFYFCWTLLNFLFCCIICFKVGYYAASCDGGWPDCPTQRYLGLSEKFLEII